MITDGYENELIDDVQYLEDDDSEECMEFQIGLTIEPETQEISIVAQNGNKALSNLRVAPIQNGLKRRLDCQTANSSRSSPATLRPLKISRTVNPNEAVDTATILSAIDNLRELMTQIAAKTDQLYEDFQQLKNKTNPMPDTPIIERTNLGIPLATKEELKAFDEKIKYDEVPRTLFKKFLLNVEDQTFEKYTSRCLFAIFKKELAVLCSFYGKNNNIEIQNLELTQILKECVQEKFQNVRNADTNHLIMKWFHLATDRYKRLLKEKS